MLSVIMLSGIMLSVIILSVIMLKVAALRMQLPKPSNPSSARKKEEGERLRSLINY
jgi:hypothetical protein